MKGATRGFDSAREGGCVSIHAPNEGSDYVCWCGGVKFGVSIHAPNEGSDIETNCLTRNFECFNPRSQ